MALKKLLLVQLLLERLQGNKGLRVFIEYLEY
jgi:hypothetical protein